MAADRKISLRERIAATFGIASGGAGTFGALHNVCHYTCEVVVAGLALAGITLSGLPFAFLQDPKLVVLFSTMGVMSLGGSMYLHIKKKPFSGTIKIRSFLDRKLALLAIFVLLSAWSLAQGTLQLVRAEGRSESPTKVSKEGSAEVELTFLNLKDPKAKEAKGENDLIFDLAINSMDMSLSSFQTYDFTSNVVLETDRGISVHPVDARITDWGHMGHHPRGKLIFPSEARGASLLKSRVVRVIIKGLGGAEKRVFEWKMPSSR